MAEFDVQIEDHETPKPKKKLVDLNQTPNGVQVLIDGSHVASYTNQGQAFVYKDKLQAAGFTLS